MHETAFDSSDDEFDLLDDDDIGAAISPDILATKQTVKITLKNQHMFDEESYASIPLLDPQLSTKYAVYRELYANILGLWGLHVSQAEILKFNGLTPYWPQDPTLIEQWYGPSEQPVSLDNSRLKSAVSSITLQATTGSPSPRKLSYSVNPSRPLNPTAPPFTPQPQIFEVQGGITRLSNASSTLDLHSLLSNTTASAQQPERFEIHHARDYLQQPSLLQLATDRARLQVEDKLSKENESQSPSRSCIVCWELVRGVSFGLPFWSSQGPHGLYSKSGNGSGSRARPGLRV